MGKTAAYVDYQQRASEFAVGDIVYPFMSGDPGLNGRVQAVYPAIGMVDVEWPHGSERVPVEELQQYFNRAGDYNPPSVGHDNVPGGADKVPVPAGPVPPVDQRPLGKRAAMAAPRVARAFIKKALYWADIDRKYRATQSEVDSGSYACPRCPGQFMRPAVYKRESGVSVRLLVCPECLFILKPCDILNHPDNVPPADG